MSGTSSPMVTRERLLCSTLSFHTSSRLLSLITREGTPRPLRSYALSQGLIASLLTYLWLRREIFTATPMSSRTWRTGPFRVITRRYASSNQSPQIEDTRANVFPAGCPNIPSSVPCCSSFTTTTGSLMIRFVHLQSLKVLLHKAKKLTSRELSRTTP